MPSLNALCSHVVGKAGSVEHYTYATYYDPQLGFPNYPKSRGLSLSATRGRADQISGDIQDKVVLDAWKHHDILWITLLLYYTY